MQDRITNQTLPANDYSCQSRGGITPYSGLYGEAPPQRGAFFKLAVHKSVGKIAILVYERVTKSAAKWKKWLLKRSISKVRITHFARNDNATE